MTETTNSHHFPSGVVEVLASAPSPEVVLTMSLVTGTPALSLLSSTKSGHQRVDLCRGQNSTLRGEVAVEGAIDGPLTDNAALLG